MIVHIMIYIKYCNIYGSLMPNAIVLAPCTAFVSGIIFITGCIHTGRSVTGINIPQKKLIGITTREVTTIR